ncbi:MAG TPA: hypothetical protein VGX93_04215, partial [Chthoniobacterales bacterium]|nr:hypothetical protein [Chthoniobacterales bacterium]
MNRLSSIVEACSKHPALPSVSAKRTGRQRKRRRDVQRWIGQERGPYCLIRLEREKGRDPLLHAVGTRSRAIRACKSMRIEKIEGKTSLNRARIPNFAYPVFTDPR